MSTNASKKFALISLLFVSSVFAQTQLLSGADYEPILALKFAKKAIINCKGDATCKAIMAMLIKNDTQIAQLIKRKLNNQISEKELVASLKQLYPEIHPIVLNQISQLDTTGSTCEKLIVKAQQINDEKTLVALEVEAQLPDLVTEMSEGNITLKEFSLSVSSMLRFINCNQEKENESKPTETAVKASLPKEAPSK